MKGSMKWYIRWSILVSYMYYVFCYCKFENFREAFIFAKLRICEVLWKIKSSQNDETTLSVADFSKLSHIHEFSKSQICLLTRFAKQNSRENIRIYSYCIYKLHVFSARVPHHSAGFEYFAPIIYTSNGYHRLFICFHNVLNGGLIFFYKSLEQRYKIPDSHYRYWPVQKY